jgi:formylglycine-generating enzyme required for sulfatase activity
MGSDSHYPEEAPAHRVRVNGFFIDPYPVTNRQFATFVAATGYRTVADDMQRLLRSQALTTAQEVGRTRLLLFENLGSCIPYRSWWSWCSGCASFSRASVSSLRATPP